MEESMADFYDLQNLLIRNFLKDTFNEDDYRRVNKDISTEYKTLKEYLENVRNTFGSKNRMVIVKASILDGKYVLTPNFKKIIQNQFYYRQINNTKFNINKKAEYLGQTYLLDDNYGFLSAIALRTGNIHPFIMDEVAESSDFIQESTIVKAKVTNESDLVSKEGALYTFYNDDNLDEYKITLDDVKEVLSILAIDCEISQNGNQFVSNTMIESDYFTCDLAEKDRLRVRIESFSNDEKALDDIDYFFEELEGKYYTINTYTEQKQNVRIVKKDRANQTLIIAKADTSDTSENDNNESYESLMDDFDQMSFDISFSNLNKQINALKKIIYQPREINRNLIKIVYSKAVFNNSPEYPISEFQFLNDDTYQGTQEQRSFVKKALATDDFMILSGPPGTGKTTAIMEFIIQAIKKNPKTKILLSASTHIAIDNVLENFINAFGSDMYKHNLFPIRVGSSDSISNKLDEYSYDKISESYGNSLASLYLLSANLVCGTTMGILKYLAGDTERFEFDYLIIDEASKTTLQEFIVPATMCDKFIIVGDINQLSPYTDTFLLETLLRSNKNINSKIETIAYYHYVIRNLLSENPNKFLATLQNSEALKELSKWEISQKINIIYDVTQIENLYGDNSIILSEHLYQKWLPIIPTTFVDVITTQELPNYIKYKLPDKIFDFSDKVESLREKSDNIVGSNWAKEVAWRYVRFHELNKVNEKYKQDLDWLIPSQLNDIKKDIEEISDITIPSVLVKLQSGVKTKSKGFQNRFRVGFSGEERLSRFVQLKYQHRMHSSIAKYAESNIYNHELKTGNTVDMKREKIKIFNDHSIFVDIHVDKMCKKDNEQEAVEITRILEVIIDKSKHLNQRISVGILSFYKAQEYMIKLHLNKLLAKYNKQIFGFVQVGNVDLEIYTVDKFQGKESDITILSLTRNKGLGFMNVPNRVNVAMTRARYYRIVVGDGNHFKKMDEPFLKNIYYDSIQYPKGELK